MEKRLTLVKVLSRFKAIYKCGYCGNEKEMWKASAKKSLSCGCHRINRMENLNLSHGLRKHPLYVKWINLRRRCYDVNDEHYKRYGARGIVMCDEWKNDAKEFIGWCLSNGYKKGLSIDRYPNNDGIYEPTNCRFATAKEQANNRCSNYNITHNLKTMTMAQWANYLNIKTGTLKSRLRKGWSEEDALTIPVKV